MYSIYSRPFLLFINEGISDWGNFNVSNYLSFNTTLGGQIQNGAKLFASDKNNTGQK